MTAPAFVLQRIAVRAEGAFGVLLATTGPDDTIGIPFAVTLERTYDTADLKGQFVKIPSGRWKCVRRWFVGGGYWTYEINVPGHTALLFHKGNVELHSEGCVLVGEQFAMLGPTPGIVDGSGLAEFLARTGGRPEFELEVRA